MPHRTLYLSDRLCEQLAGDTSSANLQDLIALGLAARQRRGVPVPLPTERLAIIERSSELRRKLAAAGGELATVAGTLLALKAQLQHVNDALVEIDAAARADSSLAAASPPAPAHPLNAAQNTPGMPACSTPPAVVAFATDPTGVYMGEGAQHALVAATSTAAVVLAPGQRVPAALPNPFRTHTP